MYKTFYVLCSLAFNSLVLFMVPIYHTFRPTRKLFQCAWAKHWSGILKNMFGKSVLNLNSQKTLNSFYARPQKLSDTKVSNRC